MDQHEYKIKISITSSRILEYDDINTESIEFDTRKMVDELNTKYVGLSVKYEGMDVDPDLQNLIFVKISATFYSSTPYQTHLGNIGNVNCTNLKDSLDDDVFLDEYFIEKMNFTVYEMVTSHRVVIE